jgi:hypothetical protein
MAITRRGAARARAHPDRLEVQDAGAAGVVGLVGDGGGQPGADAVRRRQRRGGVRLVDEPGGLQDDLVVEVGHERLAPAYSS